MWRIFSLIWQPVYTFVLDIHWLNRVSILLFDDTSEADLHVRTGHSLAKPCVQFHSLIFSDKHLGTQSLIHLHIDVDVGISSTSILLLCVTTGHSDRRRKKLSLCAAMLRMRYLKDLATKLCMACVDVQDIIARENYGTSVVSLYFLDFMVIFFQSLDGISFGFYLLVREVNLSG